MSMSNNSYPPTSFQIACELGVPYIIHQLGKEPARQIVWITDHIKQAARYLKTASFLSHNQCLEAISTAGGFSDWYGLSQHMAKASTFSDQAPEVWVNRFTSIFPLFLTIDDDSKPNKYGLALINEFTKKLSISTGLPETTLMDALFARLCHSNSWGEVMARTPLISPIPYYSFQSSDPHSSPHFEASSACSGLTIELDAQGLWDSDVDIDALITQMTKILAQRPDYLDGWAWLAGITCDFDLNRALSIVDKGIEQAESLLPKGFRGKLDWGSIGNREYLRMLNTKRMIHMERGEDDLGEIKKAIRIANKLMKLCPNDNMGVRLELPEMIEMRETLESDSPNSL
jgi:hypothetical protein